MGTKTRLAVCPKCGCNVSKVFMAFYEQNSYECGGCGSWGPWSERHTVRNPDNPKKKTR